MSAKNKHKLTELELIIDLHKNSERQGPGSVADTLRALDSVTLPDKQGLKIADIGCGSGGQTITLARNINGQILAIDLFAEFLDELNKRICDTSLTERITTLQESMAALPFGKEVFDLIWSEGAIYNIGFENGISLWKDYLKPGGFISVSEITWTTHTRPSELEEYWIREYPEMSTASSNIQILEQNNFTLEGYFNLSSNSWIDEYYKPMEARFDDFLERHGHSKLAKQVVQDHKSEIALYKEYKDYFSYGFYIARKN